MSLNNPSDPSFPKPRFPRPRFQNPNQNKDEHRLNERIRVPQVRLIDEKGNQVGVVATQEALRMAKSKGLDLMEVAATAHPPVCRILDYGKFKYEKKKKDHAAKKKQAVIKIKEVQLRPNTDDHDIDYKFRNVRVFLEEGDKAKITMLFRGREVAQADAGIRQMKKLAQLVEDIAMVEAPPKLEGRKLIMILAPAKKSGGAKKADAPAADKPMIIKVPLKVS